MPRLNRAIIASNVREAREQLAELEAALQAGTPLSAGGLEVSLAHAYHHLNFAWNARYASLAAYRQLSADQFNVWGQYPSDLELPALE